MTRRTFLAGVSLGTLAACGGGAVATAPACAAPPTLISIWGDSTHSGGFARTPQEAGGGYLNPRPTARVVQQLGGAALGIDRSIPGWGIEAHAGGWASTMAMDPAGVIVLRFGGADTLGGIPPDLFSAVLNTMAGVAQLAGKRVVLVGIIYLARRPEWQDPIGMTADIVAAQQLRSAVLNDAVRAVATRRALPFADIRALPFDPATDIADAVHPAQGYSNRCADAIAACLKPLLS